MATAFGGVFGGNTEHQLDGASVYYGRESCEVLDGINAGVEGLVDDPVETYFACITTCSLDDGDCITICTEELRQSQ
ncbi:hypothetical protein [Synechococcus sp. BA-132 BA5]|uniref:hypothetical protein n=1 Tax=Synechococcus sp. BA-132 BA5 TaxID=3110252 RepID=UPI002B1FFA9D|nr:hypothetical protein [Synechococcus sp. BA-132 BA5]MEA5415881.1 hypothetical protein [Synechococcus sp. BA-132 BA5]